MHLQLLALLLSLIIPTIHASPPSSREPILFPYCYCPKDGHMQIVSPRKDPTCTEEEKLRKCLDKKVKKGCYCKNYGILNDPLRAGCTDEELSVKGCYTMIIHYEVKFNSPLPARPDLATKRQRSYSKSKPGSLSPFIAHRSP